MVNAQLLHKVLIDLKSVQGPLEDENTSFPTKLRTLNPEQKFRGVAFCPQRCLVLVLI